MCGGNENLHNRKQDEYPRQVGLSRFANVCSFPENLPARYGFEAPAE